MKGLSKTKGYKELRKKVLYDINERQSHRKEGKCNRFNPNGCDKRNSPYRNRCSHDYCSKFKWIIDRAKHYSHKTGVPVDTILNKWVGDCNYWYVNYFQESNQSRIQGKNVRVFENVEEFQKSAKKSEYRCPRCGGVTTDPYTCNSGVIITDGIKDNEKKKCNWKTYGLFGTFGKGATIFFKDKLACNNIFMPVAWEKDNK